MLKFSAKSQKLVGFHSAPFISMSSLDIENLEHNEKCLWIHEQADTHIAATIKLIIEPRRKITSRVRKIDISLLIDPSDISHRSSELRFQNTVLLMRRGSPVFSFGSGSGRAGGRKRTKTFENNSVAASGRAHRNYEPARAHHYFLAENREAFETQRTLGHKICLTTPDTDTFLRSASSSLHHAWAKRGQTGPNGAERGPYSALSPPLRRPVRSCRARRRTCGCGGPRSPRGRCGARQTCSRGPGDGGVAKSFVKWNFEYCKHTWARINLEYIIIPVYLDLPSPREHVWLQLLDKSQDSNLQI